jgi:hypothetical protein
MKSPSQFATGNVRFSRYMATTESMVYERTRVKTKDGLEFDVVGDRSHPCFDSARMVYHLSAGQYSITVPVRAVREGENYNVPAEAITIMVAAGNGIDTVTNPEPLTGGAPYDRLYAHAKTSLDDLYVSAAGLVKAYGGPEQWNAFVKVRSAVERIGGRS